ncbi:MAG: molybdopterin molybdotransferase MoeA, partial [Planctomycetaceae bacterium]|nr:molybdopterin molybdotransferase MoeA [Planctomycetaceae bacterium]
PAEVLSIDACITRKGGIIKAGSPLLKKGVRVAATHVAALAEFGIKNVPAIRQPRVAILATGDELVDAASEPNAGQIRNSNEPMLEAQVKNCRCWPIPLGIARDNREELAARIRQGLTADVLLLTGGVSVGIHDFVPSELAAANVRKVFHGVKMKPGKPIWFGIYETAPAPQQPPHRCLVYGLPGNPVSSLVCFELFVRPALQLLQAQPERTAFQAKLKEDAIVRGDRPVYHPAVLTLSKDAVGIAAQIIPWGGSSDVCTTASANGMALLQPEHGPYKAGDTVEARLWTEFFHD